jgi:hypothetical protein
VKGRLGEAFVGFGKEYLGLLCAVGLSRGRRLITGLQLRKWFVGKFAALFGSVAHQDRRRLRGARQLGLKARK